MENQKKLVLPKTLLGNFSNPINLEEEEEEQQEQQKKNLTTQTFEQFIENLNVNNKKRMYDQAFFERENKKKVRLENPLSKEEEEQEYRYKTSKAIDDMMIQLREINNKVISIEDKVNFIEEKIEPDKYKGPFSKIFHRM